MRNAKCEMLYTNPLHYSLNTPLPILLILTSVNLQYREFTPKKCAKSAPKVQRNAAKIRKNTPKVHKSTRLRNAPNPCLYNNLRRFLPFFPIPDTDDSLSPVLTSCCQKTYNTPKSTNFNSPKNP